MEAMDLIEPTREAFTDESGKFDYHAYWTAKADYDRQVFAVQTKPAYLADLREALGTLVDTYVLLKAEFSGGGDEGSVDEVYALDATGEHQPAYEAKQFELGVTVRDILESFVDECGYVDYNGQGISGVLTVDLRTDTFTLTYSVEEYVEQTPVVW